MNARSILAQSCPRCSDLIEAHETTCSHCKAPFTFRPPANDAKMKALTEQLEHVNYVPRRWNRERLSWFFYGLTCLYPLFAYGREVYALSQLWSVTIVLCVGVAALLVLGGFPVEGLVTYAFERRINKRVERRLQTWLDKNACTWDDVDLALSRQNLPLTHVTRVVYARPR